MRRNSVVALLAICAVVGFGPSVTASSHREATTCTIDPFTFDSVSGGRRDDGKIAFSASGQSMLHCPEGHSLDNTTSRFDIKGVLSGYEVHDGGEVFAGASVMHYPQCDGTSNSDQGIRHRGSGSGTSTPDGATFTIDARGREGSRLHFDLQLDWKVEEGNKLTHEGLRATNSAIANRVSGREEGYCK